MFDAIGEGHRIMHEGVKKEIDLGELERLAKAATPGPWGYGPYPSWDFMYRITGRQKEFLLDTHIAQNGEANAAYIVAACNAVPELVARVRELERQREFFLKALNDNRLCPNGGCGGLNLDEWDCTATDNRECWIQASKKEAGE